MSVLALPLTLNASEGFDATTSRATSPGTDVTLGTQPTPEASAAALNDDLPGTATSRHERRTVEVTSPKGTRTWSASSLTDNGVPSAARNAYERAARTMAGVDPGCQLPWTLLAGVGRVESDHGRYGGSVLGANGVSRPLIIGVALDGVGPVAAIPDTDNGRLDKDKVWDRAVGPMQFIPSTWKGSARDGDGDGVSSPNDIDDAALAAAAYLCSGTGSVLGESAMSAAIFRYNASKDYVALVMAMEEGYRTGVFIMPSVVTEPADRPKREGGDGRRHGKRNDGPSGGHAGTQSSPAPDGKSPGGKPSGGTAPSPNPPGGSSPTGGGGGGNGADPKPPPSSPPPSPQPEPTTEKRTGTLAQCGAGWCLSTVPDPLDLGGEAKLDQTALSDYDLDGSIEANRQELQGLSDGGVTVTVLVSYGTTVVIKVQGKQYA